MAVAEDSTECDCCLGRLSQARVGFAYAAATPHIPGRAPALCGAWSSEGRVAQPSNFVVWCTGEQMQNENGRFFEPCNCKPWIMVHTRDGT